MATAKKQSETSEMSVEQKLKTLYELQQIDSEIDKILLLRGELPVEVQDLEDEISGLETRAHNANAEVTEIENLISKKLNDIEIAKIKIKKYQEQQENVRNSREFESIAKEVEFQGLEIEHLEKQIREHNLQIKEKKELAEAAMALLADRQIDLDAKRAELAEITAETQKEEDDLRVKSASFEALIDSRLLEAYKRIRKNARNGLAVVTVNREACGGCFNMIPPQRKMDIQLGKKIIVCEYCGRILVSDEYNGNIEA